MNFNLDKMASKPSSQKLKSDPSELEEINLEELSSNQLSTLNSSPEKLLNTMSEAESPYPAKKLKKMSDDYDSNSEGCSIEEMDASNLTSINQSVRDFREPLELSQVSKQVSKTNKSKIFSASNLSPHGRKKIAQ
jgi:hypothetical protein